MTCLSKAAVYGVLSSTAYIASGPIEQAARQAKVLVCGNGGLHNLQSFVRSTFARCVSSQEAPVAKVSETVASMAARGASRAAPSPERSAAMNGTAQIALAKVDKAADFANYFCESRCLLQ
jgi:hypothetical protein